MTAPKWSFKQTRIRPTRPLQVFDIQLTYNVSGELCMAIKTVLVLFLRSAEIVCC